MGQEPREGFPAEAPRMVQLGKIVGTHGVRGLVRLRLFNPQSSTLKTAREVFLSKGPEVPEPYELLNAQPHRRGLILLELNGIQSMGAAEALVGCKLFVPEDTLPQLSKGEYYAYQLKELEVITTDGRQLGKVVDVLQTRANDILVVRHQGVEEMIPMVDEVISQVDITGGRIVVKPLEGMIA